MPFPLPVLSYVTVVVMSRFLFPFVGALLKGLEPITFLLFDYVLVTALLLRALFLGRMMIPMGRLNPWVNLKLCRLRVGMVTTVLALQFTSIQLVT